MDTWNKEMLKKIEEFKLMTEEEKEIERKKLIERWLSALSNNTQGE